MKQRNLITILVAFFTLSAGFSQAAPVAVTLLKSDGNRQIGFIKDTNEKGVLFLFTENDTQGMPIPHSQIRAVSFTDEGDIMGPARHAYSRERYEEAEQLFRSIADEYGFLWGISRDQLGNFASDARFYQIDCLRRLGRYAEMGPALDTKTGETLEDTIDEVHLPTLKIFHLWDHLAQENWEELSSGLAEYIDPLEGKAAELLHQPTFKEDNPPSVLVQLNYMRGALNQSRDEDEKALRDFYRTMTLGYGTDTILTKNAMESALAIQVENPKLAESEALKSEIYALTVIYRDAYNSGEIDFKYRDYTQMPDPVQKQMEERQKARAEAEAEAVGEAAPEPAPADAETEKEEEKKDGE